MLVSDGTGIHHIEAFDGKRRLRIPRAEGMERANLLDELRCDFGQLHFSIDVQGRNSLPPLRPFGHYGCEPLPKLVETRIAHRDARRAGMPAKGIDEIPAGCQALIQVESTDGARRSLADTLLINRDHDRRTMKSLDESCRGNPHDANMPTAGSQDKRRRQLR